MIRVMIAEDSPVAREFLTHIFDSDPEIKVVGIAENGREAVEKAGLIRPDIITMDIHMPIMDGFEATRKIMETNPTPIVIVSSSTRAKEVASTFRAMEAGALAVILRPPAIGHSDYDPIAKELIRTVKTMSEVKVVRRIQRGTKKAFLGRPPFMTQDRKTELSKILLAAVGASTGGPPTLRKMLSGLPHNLSFPILIVQHMARGFTEGFAEWLSEESLFPVHIASHKERPLSGHAYIAPDGFHMEMDSYSRIVLRDHAPDNGLRPSVSKLFSSVAQVFGPSAVGILLTGMGKDGAKELKEMKERGAITIAQDKESSVVHGMPGEAVRIDAATYILPPEGIAEFLVILSKIKDGGL